MVSMRCRAALALALSTCTVALGCTDGGTTEAEREGSDYDAIIHVLPEALPDDWTVGHATERLEWAHGLNGERIPVSDYTIVFRPRSDAGVARGDSTSNDGASIGINSGSRYYTTLYLELFGHEPLDPPELADASPHMADGRAELEFTIGCCVVHIAGEVTETELRRVAESIIVLDHDTWRDRLGGRLHVDDQRDE
jgi:hypothetical protein